MALGILEAAALELVLLLFWVYETIAWLRKVISGSSIVNNVLFATVNIILMAFSVNLSSIPVVEQVGQACSINATVISGSNITSTTSICNAVFKPYPTTHVFIVPYYLFLIYTVIGLLFTIYAAVKYVLKQTRKLPI
jgi:hypothetical protein